MCQITIHMASLLPELTSEGLTLWRLRRTSDDQLWCSASEFSGELVLTVHDLASDQTKVAETHWDVVSLVDRSEELRDDFIQMGWTLVDVDLVEP